MTAVLTSLLCLGLSLGQRLQAQAGIVPRPTIWAEPGSTVMRGRTVTIWCQGSLEAMEYHLHKEGTPEIWDKQQPLEPSSKAKFCIQQMTVDYAGRYRCSYVSNTGMSALSYPLDLVLTGVYDSPTLSALPSTGVTSGGSVMLQCGSSLQFDRFTLCREGDQQCSWTLDSKQASRGLVQAVFSVGPVTPSHTWTFRCYGHFNSHPHVWSSPSDALQLLVSGEEFLAFHRKGLGSAKGMGTGSLGLQRQAPRVQKRMVRHPAGLRDIAGKAMFFTCLLSSYLRTVQESPSVDQQDPICLLE
ncbi:leukocyte immunoglobulin-like receptor subfamily A member 5 [Tenrec ecaudatus]|uniref:leukocyte immunoglobulin-like receptor subfamily A member 5 n=1 Tax=Tenrec ecaudatus TaxID=94439 RepID=UPI003F5A9DF0